MDEAAQFDFVPGRNISSAIYIFTAENKAATSDEALQKIIVLLLDFAKASHTLKRPFLLAVLTWRGFSKTFVNIIGALHENTTSRFIVNGFLTHRVPMHCGIRQGFPIAPLLFILALYSAYKVLQVRGRFMESRFTRRYTSRQLLYLGTLMTLPSTFATAGTFLIF